ncbi:ccr4 associated factor [Elasticomyces elasticus]|nr:ccr4 associated factor [Elasticomyces elasticus]
MYEMFRGLDGSPPVSTQSNDWHHHIDGIAKLLELRGPEMHTSDHSRALFLDARITGIKKRKAAVLSSGKWRDVPWKHCPRDLRDELMDVYADLAEQLEEQDEFAQRVVMKHRSNEPVLLSKQADEIFNRCMETGASLLRWESHALRRCAEANESISISPRLEDNCCAHGFGFFHLVMQYWAACIIGYSRARALVDEMPTGGSCRSHIPDPRIFASAIARHCSRYFEPESGLLGPRGATVPMGVALQYYHATGQEESPEMEEMGRVFRECKLAFMTCEWLRSAEAADPEPL